MGAVDMSHDEQATPAAGPATRAFYRDVRLRTHADLAYVKKRGRRRAGRRCVVSVAESRNGRRGIAIIISRRYSRKAVTRNRARRLFREAYRVLLPRLSTAWIVLIPRRAMEGAKLRDVLEETTAALNDLGVLARGDEAPRNWSRRSR